MSLEGKPFTNGNDVAEPPQGEFNPFSKNSAEDHEKGPEQIADDNLAGKEKGRGKSRDGSKEKKVVEETDDSSSDDDDNINDSDDDSDGSSGSDNDSNGSDDDSSGSDDESSGSDDDSIGSDDESDSSDDSTSSKTEKKTNSTPSSPTDNSTPKTASPEEEDGTPTMVDRGSNDDTLSSLQEETSEDMMSKILRAQLDLTTRFEEEVKARKADRKELWGMLDVLNHNIKCLLEADDIDSENMAYIKGNLKYVVDCLGPRRKVRRETTGR